MLNGPYRSDGSYSGGGPSVLAGPATTAQRARRPGVRIAGVAVSHREEALTQAQALERLGLAGDEFAEGIFARCGVQRRHLTLDEGFLERNLEGRTPQIEQQLLEHAVRAVETLDVDPRRVGTVLSASLYSLGCPSLAHRLVERFDMDPATDKYHLTAVGCAGGVPLMRLAGQTLGEHPHKHVLVVAAESMSGLLRSATEEDPRAKTVGSAIFGDGCAATLLSGEPDAQGPAIVGSQVHQIGGTLGAVSLELHDEASYLHLARELPQLAGAGLPAVVEGFLERHRLERSRIDHWIVHPGGRRIIENVRDALELTDEDVATSWNALADHGNVGTPSIMYVLKDTIDRHRPEPGELGMMVTIGPGVTVGLMLLEW